LTEIPEHLLKRSRERRSAMGLSGGDEGAADAAAPVPASDETAAEGTAVEAAPAAAAAVVDPEAPKPPEPLPPYIEAYHRRRRIPFWAMPVLAALPLWAYVFQGTLEPPPAGESDPLVLGQKLFTANCASCHGAKGGGGVGPSFQNGAVIATWPDFNDHLEWVHLGDAGWPGDTYGAQDKPKGSGMPSFAGKLSDEEIALIVRYEREELAGGDPEPDLVTLSEEAAKTEGGGGGGGH
jgi:mono/diheme cytochrome c family protein